jgi:hypothetical protein
VSAGLLAAGACTGAALTLALAGGLGRDHAPGQAGAPSPHIIRPPASTLMSDTSGKVKLTMRPEKLFRPARLQRDLARFVIPARVTSGRFCTIDQAQAGFARAVSVANGRHPTITIDRSAIRPGAELSFGRFRLGFGQAGFVALIRRRANTCTSTLPSGQETGPWAGYFGLP